MLMPCSLRAIGNLSLFEVTRACRLHHALKISLSWPHVAKYSKPARISRSSCSALCFAANSRNLPSALLSTSSSGRGSAKKSIEDTFLLKSGVEHVLLRPDTYVGSVTPVDFEVPVFDAASHRMVRRSVAYSAALLKIFDEILVNAADNMQRASGMTRLRVQVDRTSGLISIWNDGTGIPVHMHSVHSCHVPELVFGHLLSGSNFDDTERRVTGGRHGYGAKLTNIFSSEFRVIICDTRRRLIYDQKWRGNMKQRDAPQVSPAPVDASDFTEVQFRPDFPRFGVSCLSEGMLLCMQRRVYDIAGCNPGLTVKFNGAEVRVKSFRDLANMYHDGPQPLIPLCTSGRWQIFVGASAGSYTHVSFVNSVATSRGGSHLAHVSDIVVDAVAAAVKKRLGSTVPTPSNAAVKASMAVYVSCLLENPEFDSQSKDFLTSPSARWGSLPSIEKKALLQLLSSTSIVDMVAAAALAKSDRAIARISSPPPRSSGGRLLIPKLEDAALAGSSRWRECTLILTEGDSAKALAVAGLSVVGRDTFGVFPLRGKFLNVRDATASKISENAEISAVRSILGLKAPESQGKTAASDVKLRYGRVLLMTDQDLDGSHIRGLFINFIHSLWPSLLQKDTPFLELFVTPIVKARKGNHIFEFFSLSDYNMWRRGVGSDVSQWRIKYYKGLGTSTSDEGREYFRAFEAHCTRLTWAGPDCGEAIDKAFRKSRVDDRKMWLLQSWDAASASTTPAVGPQGLPLLTSKITTPPPSVPRTHQSFREFIDEELLLFSLADNVRSIPSVIDGLKPGQRKVLFASFKKRLTTEMKVAQLAGYVAEQTAYHHGEVSLHSTIVAMAQAYVGANNVPLLEAIGQFGTRLAGGADAASARYLFTRLSPVTRMIFATEDDVLLSANEDDGQLIEPKMYVPILPVLLLNGCEGIGTGWSTNIPPVHPLELIDYMLELLQTDADFSQAPGAFLAPFYAGFKGTIAPSLEHDQIWDVCGVFTRKDSHVIITELPVRVWTEDYKEHLDALCSDSSSGCMSYREFHSESSVHFEVAMSEDKLSQMSDADILHMFKLKRQLRSSNMHAITASGAIRKYNTAADIVKDFMPVRLDLFQRRLVFLRKQAAVALARVRNQVSFVKAVLDGQIKLVAGRLIDVEGTLADNGFQTHAQVQRKLLSAICHVAH
jgi:DNA topoisomerase II